jgi:hypothetical protein
MEAVDGGSWRLSEREMEAERKRDGGCGWRELGLDLEDLAGMTSAGLAVMSANIFMETF